MSEQKRIAHHGAMQKRRDAFERAVCFVEAEGLKVPASALALGEQIIAGTLTTEEAIAKFKAEVTR